MRCAAVTVAVVLTLASSAAAETRSAPGPGAVTQLLLLEGYRSPRAATTAPPEKPGISSNRPSEQPREETLTEAVQRMWSQVRAYRRPGGAEVLLRGSF